MLSGNGRDKKYIDPSSARNYSNNNAIQYKQAKDFIDRYGKLIKGPVLDIGSGDGSVTAYIAGKFAVPITGLDISDARVAYANQTYGNHRISFVAGDAVRMHYQPEITSKQYGTVVSFSALHHVPAHMHFLLFRNVFRLLNQDGRALFLIPGRSPELHDAINETANSDKWKDYFTGFDLSKVRAYETPEHYRLHFLRSGFYRCDVTLKTLEGGKDLDVAGMKRFLSGWLPHLAHLKIEIHGHANVEDTSDRLLQDIVEKYFQKMNKNTNETVHPCVTQNIVIAYASKQSFFNCQTGKTKRQKTDENITPRARL